MSQHPLISVSQLAFERDDILLFADVSFTLAAGDILQIEGPNGSGKTTLFRLLTGTLRPLSGSICYRGTALDECRHEYLSSIFYLSHQPAVKRVLTAEENLRFGVSAGYWSRQQIAETLHRVGLAGYEDVPCYTLSAGQHRRVALARLLLSEAPIWYLDEPYTAIDKQGVAFLEQCMQEHAARGGAVLLSTHQDIAIPGVRKYQLQPANRVVT